MTRKILSKCIIQEEEKDRIASRDSSKANFDSNRQN